jgi:hypothetical protein
VTDALPDDGRRTPGGFAADTDGPIRGLAQRRSRLSLGISTLDEIVPVFEGRGHVVVIALPWEPAGETPFVIAQALARQGARPLCLYPSWSPYWDGALDVHRVADITQAGPVLYESFGERAQADGTGAIVIDQFSRLHWDAADSHAAREDIIGKASRDLHFLAKTLAVPVVVFIRRRTRDVVRMSVDDLRSDGALEYEAEALMMVDPHPETATADVLVVKHRNGPTGLRTALAWPVLPRTVYRRTTR